MKRSDKEIKAEIARLEKIKDSGKMGAYRAYDQIEALQNCLAMDGEEIEGKIEEIADTDYEIYCVYDWAINGRDSF